MFKKILQLVLWISIFPNISYAIKVSPMELNFGVEKPTNTQTIVISNTSPVPLPVEIVTFSRSIDLKGEETRTPTSDFIIFPKQVILKPNEQRNIRLTWTGKTKPKSELSYRVLVKQTPVDVRKSTKKGKGSIDLVFNYMASAYVSPENVSPKLEVTKMEWLSQWKVKTIVENKGDQHAILSFYDVFMLSPKISGNKSRERKIDDQYLGNGQLAINILANSSREVIYDLPPKSVTKDLKLVFRKKKYGSDK